MRAAWERSAGVFGRWQVSARSMAKSRNSEHFGLGRSVRLLGRSSGLTRVRRRKRGFHRNERSSTSMSIDSPSRGISGVVR